MKYPNLIIGISCYFHDSAISVISNDEILYAIQEERLSRVKNDSSFPINALKSALSYFVGSDDDFTEDKGFALNPWIQVEFDNCSINIYDDIATAMGNYFFTDPSGEKTKVEFSFVYKKNKEGEIKIVLHHSSIPFKD